MTTEKPYSPRERERELKGLRFLVRKALLKRVPVTLFGVSGGGFESEEYLEEQTQQADKIKLQKENKHENLDGADVVINLGEYSAKPHEVTIDNSHLYLHLLRIATIEIGKLAGVDHHTHPIALPNVYRHLEHEMFHHALAVGTLKVKYGVGFYGDGSMATFLPFVCLSGSCTIGEWRDIAKGSGDDMSLGDKINSRI